MMDFSIIEAALDERFEYLDELMSLKKEIIKQIKLTEKEIDFLLEKAVKSIKEFDR